VDSRGRIQNEIGIIPAQSGQDLVSTIDLDLQMVAEEKLETSASKRGTLIAMDPRNGEMLVHWRPSPPSTRTFSFRAARRAKGGNRSPRIGKSRRRPLYNRAIQGRYPPGSTWKIPMSVGGFPKRCDHRRQFRVGLRRRYPDRQQVH
jgi:penicillin-binding protein 2